MENKTQSLPAAADSCQPCEESELTDDILTLDEWISSGLDRHTPLWGEAAVRDAIAAETERCANVARLDGADGGPSDICCDGCHLKSAIQIAFRIRGVCDMCGGAGRYTKRPGEFNAEYNPYRQCHRCSGSGRRTE